MMLRIARWLIFLVALVALLVWTSRRRLRAMLKDAPSGSRPDPIDDALKESEEAASRMGEVAHALRAVVQQIRDLLHSLPHRSACRRSDHAWRQTPSETDVEG